MGKLDIDKLVNEYPTLHKEGFTNKEMRDLILSLKDTPINMDKFNSTMMGNTCMMINGMVINYHCDVIMALTCGIENRDQTAYEWD